MVSGGDGLPRSGSCLPGMWLERQDNQLGSSYAAGSVAMHFCQ